jgi:hypothetical protein
MLVTFLLVPARRRIPELRRRDRPSAVDQALAAAAGTAALYPVVTGFDAFLDRQGLPSPTDDRRSDLEAASPAKDIRIDTATQTRPVPRKGRYRDGAERAGGLSGDRRGAALATRAVVAACL